MRDIRKLADAFAKEDSPIRARFGTIVSVAAGGVCTVTIGNSTTSVTDVPYLSHVLPRAGDKVMLLTDGVDLLIAGHLYSDVTALAPRAYMTAASTQSIPNNAYTTVNWTGGAVNDPWGCWSSGANTRLTVPIQGRYIAVASTRFASNATGYRGIRITYGGVNIALQQVPPVNGAATLLTVSSCAVQASAGDIFEVDVFQNSGAALNIVEASSHSPSFSIVYVG